MTRYRILLFIAGDTELSLRAQTNLQRLCEGPLRDRCEVDIIDILKDASAARQHRVIATPLVLRLEPLPQRKVIGDLSDVERLLNGLGIRDTSEARSPGAIRDTSEARSPGA
jgi:circadian clock protein KaiB